MAKSKSKKLPKFGSLDKLVEFFETTDTSEFWDQMPEVKFDISIKQRTHLVAIDESLTKSLSLQNQKRSRPRNSLTRG